MGSNRTSKAELKSLFPELNTFATPKPSRLIERILSIATNPGDIVLDSFAGSGTTGHAVLSVNARNQDKISRKIILVEMDSNICRNVTAERLKRVCTGYNKPDGKNIEALGGGFRFATLGDPLFDERGNIRKTVKFPDLARHVYFTETGEPLPDDSVHRSKRSSFPLVGNLSSCETKKDAGQASMTKKTYSPLIGICNGVAVYLLYNGILKDKTPDGGNVLTTAVLSHLHKHNGPKVIYGTACRIGVVRLRQENIMFKQLPYKLKVDAL